MLTRVDSNPMIITNVTDVNSALNIIDSILMLFGILKLHHYELSQSNCAQGLARTVRD